jgi:hypothetical protein
MFCEVWERLRREEEHHRQQWAYIALLQNGHLHGQSDSKDQQLAIECMKKWREASRRVALDMGGTCPDCADRH